MGRRGRGWLLWENLLVFRRVTVTWRGLPSLVSWGKFRLVLVLIILLNRGTRKSGDRRR